MGRAGQQVGQALQWRSPGIPGREGPVIEQVAVRMHGRVVELDLEEKQFVGHAAPRRSGLVTRCRALQEMLRHGGVRVSPVAAQQQLAQAVQAPVALSGRKPLPPRPVPLTGKILGGHAAQGGVEQGHEQQVAAAAAEPQTQPLCRPQLERLFRQRQQTGLGQAPPGFLVEQQALFRQARQVGGSGSGRGHGAAHRLPSGSVTRRKRAASSGGMRLMKKPLPHSNPAIRLRRGTSSMCQW